MIGIGLLRCSNSDGAFPLALANLETAVLDACAAETEWPAQVAAGIYAGVDYAIANPEVARTLADDTAAEAECLQLATKA